jgi:hypothetical protein
MNHWERGAAWAASIPVDKRPAELERMKALFGVSESEQLQGWFRLVDDYHLTGTDAEAIREAMRRRVRRPWF